MCEIIGFVKRIFTKTSTCDYCNIVSVGYANYSKSFTGSKDDDNFYAKIDEDWYYDYTTDSWQRYYRWYLRIFHRKSEDLVNIPVKYCPMCGRKLKDV